MDWIDQHQKEEAAKKAAEEQARAASAARDKAGQSWISALLESRLRHSIEQVNQRLGRNLNLTHAEHGYGFRVFERRSSRTFPEYDWFEVSCWAKDANEIRVSGNKGRDPRAMPDSFDGSPNDWHGKQWDLKVRPRGPQLLGDEDIDVLFRWLIEETGPQVPQLTLESTEPRKAGCFVATAVYGSSDVPQLKTLRFFRDHLLLPTSLGRILVNAYYWVGPPISRLIERSRGARLVARLLIVAPAVLVARCMATIYLSVKHR